MMPLSFKSLALGCFLMFSQFFTAIRAQDIVLTDAIATDNTDIQKLSLSDFTKYIKSHDLVLAEFTMPWCPHSKILLPTLMEAATRLKEHDINVIQINCENDTMLCSHLTIEKYPTLKVIKKHRLGNTPEYTGTRTVDAIVQFMLDQTTSAVHKIESDEEMENYLQDVKLPVVVNNGLSELSKVFGETAENLINQFVFVSNPNNHSNEVTLYIPRYNITGNSTSLETAVYDGSVEDLVSNPKKLSSWLSYSILPYFMDGTPETLALYMKSDLPLAYFFYSDRHDFENYRDMFNDLGKTYRGKINFIALNSNIAQNHVKFLDLKQQYPIFVIHDSSTNFRYALPQLPDDEYLELIKRNEMVHVEKDDILKLVEDFANGEATPIMKSEEVPTVQDGLVYKLVSQTHDEIVHNPERDVIVRYYAPWCSHSKRLAKVFEEMAGLFASNEEFKDKIMFADIDSTKNDLINFPVTTYPLVALYPAGSTEPVIFSGIRIAEKILDFIKENGTHHIDGIPLLAEIRDVVKFDENGNVIHPEDTVSGTSSDTSTSTSADASTVAHDEL
ncbi:hypothetical protein KAFR_0G01240 [Kazachstania africana CBS 2517]|uniref:protein disulfide-isomerase n=1 Tax=Kazachstania africana (strain ATCC 22294 / BCRC 22015 / CBS 2517 / CECT 1963 / NBRC 1671 / NRRL Y-8276) TaxID=1071382 RepID=H2AXQ8_KAZAF|nr:hypothetical protein KAFR_0G01240 [Kazachstania africana CBS 2517]CCF59158.1 hypothetical protein KAFR_0G01240 [Kazachstania africana CBS 2517]